MDNLDTFYKKKSVEILKYSNPKKVHKNAEKYFGFDKDIYLSYRPDKKYMLKDDNNNIIHFGQMGYEDYTKHQDKERMLRYRKRAENIRGNWKNNKYSPNNLSINLLW